MTVDDIDRIGLQSGLVTQLLGARAGPIRPAIQPDRRIVTVSRSAGLAVPLAIMSAAKALDATPRSARSTGGSA